MNRNRIVQALPRLRGRQPDARHGVRRHGAGRLLVVAAVVFGLALAAPVVLAADPVTQTERVLVSTQGDVTIPAGEEADVVVVVRGNANIQGAVNTLVVVEGTANLSAARLETVVAVRSNVEVGSGTVVTGEVQQFDSTVNQAGDAQIAGGVTDLTGVFLEFGAVLGPALFLAWIGFGLAAIAFALLLAGIASRQLREAGRLIGVEPVQTFLAGLGAVILIPILAILLMVTIIGAPLGVGILLGLFPLVAFVGYLFAAIWIGDWVVRRMTSGAPSGRPFLGAAVGVVILQVVGFVPILNLLVAIVSLLGVGAVIRLAFTALRGRSISFATAPRPARTGSPG
jgi:hypothetical protein